MISGRLYVGKLDGTFDGLGVVGTVVGVAVGTLGLG